MLRTYESVYVTTPEATEDKLAAVNSKIKEFITTSGGEIGTSESWGVRDLSYKSKKQKKGRYNYVSFTANPNIIKDLEFYLKISEEVLRFITVKLEEGSALDKIRKPDVKNL